MSEASSYDPSDLPGYIPLVTVPPVNNANVHIGIVVFSSNDVSISHIVGGQKRSREEPGSNDAAEPVSKRLALSTRLDDVNPDIDMSDAQNICPSLPGNFCSSSAGKFHVIDSPPLCLWDPDDNNIWGLISWESVEKYTENCLCHKEEGGSYWYRMSSSDLQEPLPLSTFKEKLIQDMDLLPDKTFFHINPMINAKKDMFGSSEPFFEFFARVVHTGCGSFGTQSFQCFKLEDLLPGQPHMSGIMMFKRKESPMNCASSPFLLTSKTNDSNGLCYCRCQVVEDDNSELGWSLYIHDIQPVTWEIILIADSNMGKKGSK